MEVYSNKLWPAGHLWRHMIDRGVNGDGSQLSNRDRIAKAYFLSECKQGPRDTGGGVDVKLLALGRGNVGSV